MLDGSAVHTLGDKTCIISKGDYFIVNYGVRHGYEQIGNTLFTVLNVLFIPRFIDETLANYRYLENITDSYLIKFNFEKLNGHPADFIYHDDDGQIALLLQRMQQEYNSRGMGYQETLRCQLIEILIRTMRKIRRPFAEDGGSDMIQRITLAIKERFTEKLSLHELAKDSLAYISKRFKAETGLTFREYLQAIRVQEACRLIANSTMKFAEISQAVGYTDYTFFCQIFKEQTGMNPSEFKRLYKHG